MGSGTGLWMEMPSGLHVYPPVALPVWLWVQTSIALLLVGVQVWQCGWAAVGKGAAPKPEKDKNGEFRKTPEKQKVRLDPLAGVDVKPREQVEEKIPLAALSLADSQDEYDDLPPLEDETDTDDEYDAFEDDVDEKKENSHA